MTADGPSERSTRPAGACPRVIAAALLAAVCVTFVLVVTGCAPRPANEAANPPRPSAGPTAVATPSIDTTSEGRRWVIFYSPHPDDESVGMGQAIRRYVREGYRVEVALLTDGETSKVYERYYRLHPEFWRDLDKDGVRGDPGDFGLERRLEFERATAALGVRRSRLSFWGAAGGAHDGLTRDYMPVRAVEGIMRSFERRHPGALHVTVMRYTDGRPNGVGDLYPQVQHAAACRALELLAKDDHVRAEFYKVYVYDLPPQQRWSPRIENDTRDHTAKRTALLDGYDMAGESHHLAIGFHSVGTLIQGALHDTREFRVTLAELEAGSQGDVDVPPVQGDRDGVPQGDHRGGEK